MIKILKKLKKKYFFLRNVEILRKKKFHHLFLLSEKIKIFWNTIFFLNSRKFTPHIYSDKKIICKIVISLITLSISRSATSVVNISAELPSTLSMETTTLASVEEDLSRFSSPFIPMRSVVELIYCDWNFQFEINDLWF